jgi:hypothetical protein
MRRVLNRFGKLGFRHAFQAQRFARYCVLLSDDHSGILTGFSTSMFRNHPLTTTVVVVYVELHCAYSVTVLHAPDVFFANVTNSLLAPELVFFSKPNTKSADALPAQ